MSKKTDQDAINDLIAVITVGSNFDNPVEDVIAVFEDIIDGDLSHAVDLLVGVTAFLGGTVESLGMSNEGLEASIKAMALAYAADPEGTLSGAEKTGD